MEPIGDALTHLREFTRRRGALVPEKSRYWA
jgi:hypothetical protein